MYFGNYVDRGNKKYITYKEYEEGNPNNYSLCIIKLEDDNVVTLTKNKKYQTKIILESGVHHYSPYYTDYGLITMSVYTYKIENNLSENGGKFRVNYSISVNSDIVSIMDLTVSVEKMPNIK